MINFFLQTPRGHHQFINLTTSPSVQMIDYAKYRGWLTHNATVQRSCAARNNGKSRLCHHRKNLFRLLLFFVDFFRGPRVISSVRKKSDRFFWFSRLTERNNSLDRREVVWATKSFHKKLLFSSRKASRDMFSALISAGTFQFWTVCRLALSSSSISSAVQPWKHISV